MTRDGIHHDGAILNVFRKRTDLVQRGSESDQAVTRNPPIGGFKAYNAAKGRGLTDGTARIRAQGSERLVSGNAGGRTTRRASGNAIEIPGIFSFFVEGCLG